MFLVASLLRMRELATGTCEHCGQTFGSWLVHCGFSDCSYAHCDKCGMTAILSYWDKRMPKLPPGCPSQQEICVELEKYMLSYVEANAPGTKKGWRWQGNWHDTYCMVIENRVVNDNFKM